MSVLSGVELKQCLLVDQNLPAALGLPRSGSQRLSEVSLLETLISISCNQHATWLRSLFVDLSTRSTASFTLRKKHILSLSSTSLMTNGDSPTDSPAEDISTIETILEKLHSHSDP